MPDLNLTSAGSLRTVQDPIARLQRAADQFETSFLQQIMAQMDKPLGGAAEDLFGDSAGMRQYRTMLNGALAEHTAGSLGIGDALVEQLLRKVHVRADDLPAG